MARKKKVEFNIVGETEDGKKVVSGVFRIFDTCGLPLDVVFDLCTAKDLMPSWIDFYEEATKQGWTDKTIFNRLSINVSDVYGRDFWLKVKERLELYIDQKD